MANIANDDFARYYTEKLWQMVPGIYRYEDGLAEYPGVLRAIIEVIGEQAAILRRSQDRLWDDQFIELCDDWAVPYIGELLATRLLSASNPRGRRIDVAKTIYYRRRKGTPRILEELISDISNWDGKLVEGFTRLVRARHGLDPKPGTLQGKVTGTPPGGTADLRIAGASTLNNGPFDEYFHAPDFRRPRGLDGRYGISKLNFYLYRLVAYPVTDVTPFFAGNDEYTFDPSGRSIPLFNDSRRPQEDWENWTSPREWELQLPIRCRLLAHAEYSLTEGMIELLPPPFTAVEKNELRKVTGIRFKNETSLLSVFNSFPALNALLALHPDQFFVLLHVSLVSDCGKSQLIPEVVAVKEPGAINLELIIPASLETWTVNATNKHLAIDAENGRFLFLDNPPPIASVSADYYYGFSGPLGAGTYARRDPEAHTPTLNIPPGSGVLNLAAAAPTDIVQISDNKTYNITSNPPAVTNFILQAANQKRPFLVLANDLVFNSAAPDATLILDGLWFGVTSGIARSVIVKGDYKCVIIRNCSFDPGGGVNVKGVPLQPVSLIVQGIVESFCIQQSIIGPVVFQSGSLLERTITICDSIVQFQPAPPSGLAISVASGTLNLLRTTVFGDLTVHRLFASDTIITGLVTVNDNQQGCFRFSAAPKASRLPHPYQSFLFPNDSNYWFTSKLFGMPAYGQLSAAAPPEIQQGAENSSEIGAFCSLINPIKLNGLTIKVEEYMPFGLIPAFIAIT